MKGRLRLLPALVVLLLAATTVRAQVNTEMLRSFDVDGYAVSLSSDAALLSGNVSMIDLTFGGRFDVRKARHYAFITARGRYGEISDERYAERFFGHARYNYDLTPRLVGELFGQLERDAFTLLQLRALAGTGLRLRHVNRKGVRLFQGSSYLYEYENLDAAKARDHPATVRVSRWSNYLNLRLNLTEQTYLVNTVYAQPRLDDFEDLRILYEAALGFALTDHLTFKTTFNLRYDSRPPGDVKTLDFALLNGLSVRF